MSSTTETGVPPADVSDLGVRDTLAAAASARRTADREEARLLELVVHHLALYPVDEDTQVACLRDRLLHVPGHDNLFSEHLAGEGTPRVAEQAVEELAAALCISYQSGCRLVADALELCYRLPRLWALVQAGRLQAWKARRVAEQTTSLSVDAVGFVDAQAAIAGAGNRLVPNLGGLVHAALIRFEPEEARRREEARQAHRDVVFDYLADDGVAGSATVTARMDLVDARDLDSAVSEVAGQLGRLGDQEPLDTRRARALGMLAHPQHVLDLFGTPANASTPEISTLNTTGATLYVHVDADDLRTHRDGTPVPGTVERLGAATLDLLQTWLQRTSGVTVMPVLDLAKATSRIDAVDRHDPPRWMRDLVILRDGHCVFPGCTVDARRCDLDHTVPHLSVDQGGPPGQTSPANLAALCRRHHRLKTFTAWTYERAGPGHYVWTNPHGLTSTSRPIPKK